MVRLIEVSRAIRESVPPELAPVFWAVTLFGSAEFILVVLSFAYWNVASRREEILRVVAMGFVALSVTLALKYWFAAPRPPAAVQNYPVTPDGFGFPSGHAVAATIVYGGALVVTDRLREPRVAVPVAGAVLLIGTSRVILGVHYLGDVLAGFVVGLVVLAGLALRPGADARRLFAAGAVLSVAGAVLSVAGLATSGLDPDALLAAGGSVGGVLATYVSGGLDSFRSRRGRAVFNALGLAVVGLALLVGAVLGSAPVAATLANVVLVFTVVALPALVGRSGVLARIDPVP